MPWEEEEGQGKQIGIPISQALSQPPLAGLLVGGTYAVGSHHTQLWDCVQALELKPGVYTVIIPQVTLCFKGGGSRSKQPSTAMQQGEDGQTLQDTNQLVTAEGLGL